MLTHKKQRERALARVDVPAEFDHQFDEFLRARAEQGLTQAQTALRIGTTQSAAARVESGRGEYSLSLATLSRYTNALGCKLEVRLVRERGQAGGL